ncbi:MAG: class II glutamine amidotransferase [Deltaproteobacteria bacterium]|nr:class II glutamine amidotransferase [Deltaproteobacteria bacterium]
MCRMLGLICNDADLLGCAIHEVRAALSVDTEELHDGVGVGYYSNDDPLLRKRPADKLSALDPDALVDGIRSRTLLLHTRRATVGAWKDVNTHPFRFRRWLFASVGHLHGLGENRESLQAELPPFLSRGIRGETDSELAFHLLLDSMFKEGSINDLSLPVESLAANLRGLTKRIDEIAAQTQHEKPSYAILVTNGQIMAAANRGVTMHYSHREGIQQCVHGEMKDDILESHRRFKGVMLGADMVDPGHQWREVAAGSLLTINQDLELKVEGL